MAEYIFDGKVLENNKNWGTGRAEGKDIFELRTSAPYYDELIEHPEIAQRKNLSAEIVQMSPEEYFEISAEKIFDIPVERLKQGRAADKKVLDDLADTVENNHIKLFMPRINLEDLGQEGLHRMMYAGNRFGWDEKFPVLVVKPLYEKKEEQSMKEYLKDIIEIVFSECVMNDYTNEDEFVADLKDRVEDKFGEFVPLDVRFGNNKIIIDSDELDAPVMMSRNDISIDEGLSRDALIDGIKAHKKFYNFSKFTDAQLFNILKRLNNAAEVKKPSAAAEDEFIEPKRCEKCNTQLTDSGYCPKCDFGEEDLDEDIEKHDTLNPKLWNEDNTLKEEVREKILEIVHEFTEDLEQDGVKFKIKDIKLVGSNCSYNYTKDSDLDIHIVMDTKSLDCPAELYTLLYSAYRSIWNKNHEINFYGIPVEIFIETDETEDLNKEDTNEALGEKTALKSNGVYSVMNDAWIKEPVAEDIPEFNEEEFDKEFTPWEDRYFDIKENPTINDVDDFIEDIYELRQESIKTDGEYGLGNLIFKECRNLGYLDDLKKLKNELKDKALSL